MGNVAGENRKPRVFISFSGFRSKSVADKLKIMLRDIFGEAIEIFNSLDIQAGSFSWERIRKELSESDYGVICITRENQVNPWIIFEAGAISRNLKAPVVPYLIDDGLKLSSKSPLEKLGFQSLKADSVDTITLLREVSETLLNRPLDETSDKAKAKLSEQWNELSRLISNLRGAGELAPLYLPELIERSWLIEDGINQDFRRWIRNQIHLKAQEAILEWAEGSWARGLGNFHGKVADEYLKPDSPEGDLTVLALCGEKGFSIKAGEKYFKNFYTFAENQAANCKDDRIRVCRIFIESGVNTLGDSTPNQRQDSLVMRDVRDKHKEYERVGVMALTIPETESETLKAYYPGIVERLAAGFGFLVFHTLKGISVITHEGQKDDFAFSVLKAPLSSLNSQLILHLFRGLSTFSSEYKGKEHERELQELFERTKP